MENYALKYLLIFLFLYSIIASLFLQDDCTYIEKFISTYIQFQSNEGFEIVFTKIISKVVVSTSRLYRPAIEQSEQFNSTGK